MSTSLVGHNALVTGGGSGIGLACAKAFVRDGAAVTLMGRSRARLEKAADEIRTLGGKVGIVEGDVGNEGAARKQAGSPVSICRSTAAIICAAVRIWMHFSINNPDRARDTARRSRT